MTDQAEKIILEGEDHLSPVVDKANKSLDGLEKQAGKTGGALVTINDKTTGSVRRLIQSLEKQSEVYGKSGVEKLIAQRDQLLQRYEKEPRAIDAINRSYDKMIETQKKLDHEQSRFGEGFAERVKQTIENPLSAAKGMMTGVLETLGPMGTAIAGGIAAFGAFAVAGYEAAKSLAEWGTRIKDVELRTGLTAKQVGEFDYAAKAVGQDVSVVERMMKGLTRAIEEDSAEAQKARAVLVGMRVDLDGVKKGSVGTAEVLLQISEHLAKMPTVWERNEAAMTLFKRAGIETIPMILELSEKVREAQAMGFGFREEDVERAHAYQGQVAAISRTWQDLARQIKEPLAVPILFVLKGMADSSRQGQNPWFGAATNFGIWATMSGMKQEQSVASTVRGGISTMMGWAPGSPGAPSAPDFSGNTAGLMTVTGANLHMAELRAKDEAANAVAMSKNVVQDAEKEITRLQGLLVSPSGKGWTPGVNDDTRDQIAHQKDIIASFKARTEAAKKAAAESKEWDRQAAEFSKKSDEAELTALGKIYYQRDLLIAQGEKLQKSEAALAKIRADAAGHARFEEKKIDDAFRKEVAKDTGKQFEESIKLGLVGPGAGQMKEWEEGFKADERIAGIEVDAQRQALRRQAARAGRMADLNPNISYEQAAVEAYQTRVDLAIQLAQIEADRIAKEENATTKRVLAAQAQKELFLELAQAQDEFDQKRAELAQKRQQELQRQMDDLTRTFDGLFHTLFAKPGDFPKQLGSTLREAALKPVTQGLSTMAAQAMHPLIYGSEGQGGLAGIFHGAFGGGKQDAVVVTSDNTTATVQNSRAIWLLTAVLSEAMGRGVPALSTQGGAGVPNVGVASPSGFIGQMLRNTGGLPRFAEGGITSGPTIVGEAGPEMVIPLSLNDVAATYGERNPFRVAMMKTEEMKTVRQAEGERIMRDVFAKDAVGMQDVVSGTVASAAMLDPRINFLGRLATLHANPSWNAALNMFSFEGSGGGSTFAAAPMAKVMREESQFTGGGLKWAVNPTTGKVRLAPFERTGDMTSPFETHTDWFERIGLPSSGPEFDRIPRGYAYLNKKGALRIDDNGLLEAGLFKDSGLATSTPLDASQFDTLTDALQRRFPGSSLTASLSATPDIAYMRDPTYYKYGKTGDRDPWGQSYEAKVAAGQKGGLVSSMNAATRRAAKAAEPRPEPVTEASIRESNANFDSQFADDAGNPYAGPDREIDAMPRRDYRGPGQGAKVLFGGQMMTFRQIAKLASEGAPLPINSNSFQTWMTKYVPKEQWNSFDLLKGLFQRGWRGMGRLPGDVLEADGPQVDLWKELSRIGLKPKGKLPSYDEGGTVASSGMAVVHQGEAVVPQADTLKKSIDANTKALQQVPQSIFTFLRSMGSRFASPQAQQGSVVLVSGPGGGQQPIVGIPEVMTGSDQMSSAGWGVGVDPYGGRVYQPGPLPPAFGGSTAHRSFSLPGLGSPSQMLHAGAMSVGTGLLSSGVRSGSPLTSAMGGAAMGYGMAPMMGTTGTWGAVTGAGAGVAMAGLSRGGWSGTATSTGGGALVGLQMGGPIGAAVGAAAGFTAGMIRQFGVETLAETAHKDIKQVYGVDIPANSGVIKQIVSMAQQQFGGSISMAVRSPSVRELVMLYSESTGQKMPLSATTPRAGSLVEQGGGLYQAPTFQNGTPYVLPSSIPTMGNSPGMGTYPMGGGATYLSVHVDGQGIAPFMTGNYMTPAFIADQSMAAQESSYYRTQQSANLQQPGLYV